MIDRGVVYLIDDDDGVRKFLSIVLTKVGMDVETFSSPSEFLAAYDARRPSCLVVDQQLPEMSGLALWKEMRKRDCAHPFILVTGHGTVSMAVEAMREGAVDVLEKPLDHTQLIASVQEALDRDLLAIRSRRDAVDVAQRLSALTSREREVMGMVVDGRLTKQIAKTLGISTKTVEVHRSNVTKKMGVASVAQLVRMVTTHAPIGAFFVRDESPAASVDIVSRN
jgi:two-component system, LuxR family, response regulator FixJ